MKFKDFIKPTIWKIVLVIILLLLTYFIPYIETQTSCLEIYPSVCKSVDVIRPGFGIPIPSPFDISKFFVTDYPTSFSVILFIFNLIVLYLISCLVFYIYKIIRGKEK